MDSMSGLPAVARFEPVPRRTDDSSRRQNAANFVSMSIMVDVNWGDASARGGCAHLIIRYAQWLAISVRKSIVGSKVVDRVTSSRQNAAHCAENECARRSVRAWEERV
jgi:hypothetical protein